MYSKKSVEPRMDPWGTQGLTEYSCEDFPSRTTWSCLLLRRYKKTCDIIPHAWIIKGLNLVDTAISIIALIKNTIFNWMTVLTISGRELGQVDINKGIFQGIPLSPSMFPIIKVTLNLALRNRKQDTDFKEHDTCQLPWMILCFMMEKFIHKVENTATQKFELKKKANLDNNFNDYVSTQPLKIIKNSSNSTPKTVSWLHSLPRLNHDNI